MRVGVKYCGNCNPQIDTPALLRDLQALAEEIDFVGWDGTGGYEVLLVINGCQVGCATRPAFDGPCIDVTSEEIRRWPVPRSELAGAVLAALKDCSDMLGRLRNVKGTEPAG